jgi:hypothetical protein
MSTTYQAGITVSLIMDKLKLTGQNQGQVFKFRRGCLHAIQLYHFETKLPNLKLKTRPKQLLGSLPVDIALPGLISLDLIFKSNIYAVQYLTNLLHCISN